MKNIDMKMQDQINELNRKVDLILDYVNQQHLRSESVDDLISDLTIVGKDAYKSVVAELEDQQVELDPEDLKILGIKLVRNIKNFISVIDMFESIIDLMKDAAPIANEIIIDFTRKLDEFEKKGYFELLKKLAGVVDTTVTQINDNNIPRYSIWKLMREMMKPEMKTSFGLIATSMKNLSQLNK